MQYQYIVTAHKASSVTASISGPFIAPHETNLVVAKGNRLEIHTLTPQGLRLVTEQQLYGRIVSLHFFHPKDRLTGLILATSDKYQFTVLSWDAASQSLVTESAGETVEKTGRPTTESSLVAIDPLCRMVMMYSYQGIVHLFPMADAQGTGGVDDIADLASAGNGGVERWPYAIRDELVGGLVIPAYLKNEGDGEVASPSMRGGSSRTRSKGKSTVSGKGKAAAHPVRSGDLYPMLTRYIEELKVLDIQFLLPSNAKQTPEFAVLYEDADMTRQVHVYRLGDSQGGEVRPISLWVSETVERAASKIIPLPGGALLVVGEESLTVVAQNTESLGMSVRAAVVTAWEWIDKDKCERLLLADDEGVLSLVVLRYETATTEGRRVRDLYVERLGDISVASSLSYLSDGCVYVGSHYGDQELVRLHTVPLSKEDIEASGARSLDPWLFAPETMAVGKNPLANPLGVEANAQEEAAVPNTFIEPMESFPNLAPVVDLCVVGVNEHRQQWQSEDNHQQQQQQQQTQQEGDKENHVADHSTGSILSEAARTRGTASSSGHGSIVTCSGLRNKPSLRIVRNGVGIERIAGLDIAGLMGAWSFTIDSGLPADDSAMDVDGGLSQSQGKRVVLVLSLVGRTYVLGWNEQGAGNSEELELEELDVLSTSVPGWRVNELTLAAALTSDRRHVVQVTPAAVVLIDIATMEQKAVWRPGDSGLASISAASVSGDQVAVAADGKTVVYIEVQQQQLRCLGSRQLEHDVSCIDIHSWDAASRSLFVAVGLWGSNDIGLLSLPDLSSTPLNLSLRMGFGTFSPLQTPGLVGSTLAGENGADTLPRSILMCSLGSTPYLLVGLGNGRLHHFAFRASEAKASPSLVEHKSVTLGTRPINLTTFVNHGTANVFAASDHSAVLFTNRQRSGASVRKNSVSGIETQDAPSSGETSKLMYANVDASDVMFVAPIESDSFPDSLCLISNGQLAIGQIDPVQKLHIRNRPLPKWAAPHRIAYNQASGTFGLATIHAIDPEKHAMVSSMSTWEKGAVMETNEQQMRLIGDVRAALMSSPPVEVGRFSVVSAQGVDVLATVMLRPFEIPESLCVASLKLLERTPLSGAEPGSPADMQVDQCESARSAGELGDAFVLGTSIVMPGEDDAHRGRILAVVWDPAVQRTRVVGCFTTLGAVYALTPFRGMLLAAVNNRLLLLGWQRKAHDSAGASAGGVYVGDADFELVVLYSQQTQITSLSIAVNGDYIAVGDLMSSVSLYRYEEAAVEAPGVAASNSSGNGASARKTIRRRLVPVARDYAGAWTTAVAAVHPPLEQNRGVLYPPQVAEETPVSMGRAQAVGYERAFRGPSHERFVVADSYYNIFRLTRTDDAAEAAYAAALRAPTQAPSSATAATVVAAAAAASGTSEREGAVDEVNSEQRFFVEARWHLGDMINVIRAGSLVMDIPDPEFPEYFRPTLVYGTVQGAVGVVASVENGKLGRVLDRLQVNLAHLLPTPGLWSYDRWRAYDSDQRMSRAFGVLDGDLIERFLDLSPDLQRLVFSGGGALVEREAVEKAEARKKAEYWASYSKIEAESDVAVLAQMAVSDIGQREGVELDYVVRLVESLTRLH
ncbi:hypothetical protein GQ54DRAFT_296163 [Martensiomyces pterosporus]|nr:hypothetical protein GQ54DRAFT_296163 [Martensiomyces pterosporus]